MSSAESPEQNFYLSRPEAPSLYHSFLHDDLQALFMRYDFYGIDRHSAVLGGVLAGFWDNGVDAEVSVVNTISCSNEPETYVLYVHPDGSFVAIHSRQRAAKWCIPGAPLLNDDEVHDTLSDLEHTAFTEAASRQHTPQAYHRTSVAWQHAFLTK
jgi:hypothetical protein